MWLLGLSEVKQCKKGWSVKPRLRLFPDTLQFYFQIGDQALIYNLLDRTLVFNMCLDAILSTKVRFASANPDSTEIIQRSLPMRTRPDVT